VSQRAGCPDFMRIERLFGPIHIEHGNDGADGANAVQE
jgi:hypothetical protein